VFWPAGGNKLLLVFSFFYSPSVFAIFPSLLLLLGAPALLEGPLASMTFLPCRQDMREKQGVLQLWGWGCGVGATI